MILWYSSRPILQDMLVICHRDVEIVDVAVPPLLHTQQTQQQPRVHDGGDHTDHIVTHTYTLGMR